MGRSTRCSMPIPSTFMMRRPTVCTRMPTDTTAWPKPSCINCSPIRPISDNHQTYFIQTTDPCRLSIEETACTGPLLYPPAEKIRKADHPFRLKPQNLREQPEPHSSAGKEHPSAASAEQHLHVLPSMHGYC